MTMRGHSSIQGSTDVPMLCDLLPGYLPQPTADPQHDELAPSITPEESPDLRPQTAALALESQQPFVQPGVKPDLLGAR
jgi:hypothetical protein